MPLMFSTDLLPPLPNVKCGVRSGDGSSRSRPGMSLSETKGEKNEKGVAASGVTGDDVAVELPLPDEGVSQRYARSS